MTLSSSTIMPSSNFRHISIMVFFMAVLMAFCGFGLIAITSIISGWSKDIDNTITVEIPAFDEREDSVLTDEQIKNNTAAIVDIINQDPVITNMESFRPDGDVMLDDRFDIPAPVFLTLYLHPDRAPNTENRITNLINNAVPSAIVKTPTEWIKNIHATANTLYFVFAGLMACVLIVTGFVVAGVVRTQIVASKDTITLIHLCGAAAKTIAGLFQTIIIKTVLKGVIPALIITAGVTPFLARFFQIESSIILYWAALPLIAVMFIFLALIVTYITVAGALRDMP